MTEQVLPFLPSSRFQLLPTPLVAPGKCAICGAIDRPVIDFGMTIQFYGTVYICAENCLHEAALGIGMVDKSELIEAQGELAQSVSEHLEQNGLVAVSNEWLRTLSSVVLGVSNNILSSDDSSSHLVSAATGEAESDLPDASVGFDLFFDQSDEGNGNESSGSEPTDFEEFLGADGDSEQSPDLVVSEGSNVLSDDNGDGNTSFRL
jgi:hypothetical protein